MFDGIPVGVRFHICSTSNRKEKNLRYLLIYTELGKPMRRGSFWFQCLHWGVDVARRIFFIPSYAPGVSTSSSSEGKWKSYTATSGTGGRVTSNPKGGKHWVWVAVYGAVWSPLSIVLRFFVCHVKTILLRKQVWYHYGASSYSTFKLCVMLDMDLK